MQGNKHFMKVQIYKKTKKSTWIKDMENKINKFNNNVGMLKRSINFKKLEKKEKKSIKKLMPNKKLRRRLTAKQEDLHQAISNLT